MLSIQFYPNPFKNIGTTQTIEKLLDGMVVTQAVVNSFKSNPDHQAVLAKNIGNLMVFKPDTGKEE